MALLNRYKLVAMIGEGSFGEVKKYIENDTAREVAIKHLKQEFVDDTDHHRRFLREIKILRQLKGHAGIVEVLDEGEHKGAPFYVMPHAKHNLSDYILTNNNKLSAKDRFDLAGQIIDAIEYAHDKGILHRDLAPTNVLVFNGESPIVKVVDFGLGKVLNSKSLHTTAGDRRLGHIQYTAPEQIASLQNASIESDVYSLGCLVGFVFTGREPGNQKSHVLAQLCKRATAHDAADRFSSVSQLKREFNAIRKLAFGSTVKQPLSLSLLAASKTSVDSNELHQLLVNGKYSGLTYYGYLDPVYDYFVNPTFLERYVIEMGPSVHEFVSRYARECSNASTQVGWPFAATSSFASLLRRIFELSNDSAAKASALVALWDIAIESDQYGAQDVLRALVSSTKIDEEIGMYLARHISDMRGQTNATLSEAALADLPESVTRAVLESRSRSNEIDDEK